MTDINIKFPLRRGASGAFETNKTTLDAVKDDLKLLVLTNHGERVVNTDFGANLRGLIFELRGPELRAAIRDRIAAAVEKWMPYVNIVDVEVQDATTTPYLNDNQVHLNIKFSIGIVDEVSLLAIKLRS
jgi:phage baseplate assembly protein W